MTGRERSNRCPTMEELSRSLSSATPDTHIEACEHCSRELAALRQVISLARTLPTPADRGDVDEQRAQLVALAERTSPAWRPRRVVVTLVVPLVAAAAAVAILLPRWMQETLPPTTSQARSVTPKDPQPPAPVTQRAESLPPTMPPPEATTASAGSAGSNVAPHAAVTPPPDQVARHRTARVEVARKTASSAEAHHPAAKTSTFILSATPPVEAGEVAFQRGIAALQAGNMSLATRELERAVGNPNSAVIEDSRFWLGVAHARAKRTRAAVDAFERFLDHHPGSVRRGEAATMLAWQLLALGERDRARTLFEEGLADDKPAVHRSARAGLLKLGERTEVGTR